MFGKGNRNLGDECNVILRQTNEVLEVVGEFI